MQKRRPDGTEKLPGRFVTYIAALERRVQELEDVADEAAPGSRLELIDAAWNARRVPDDLSVRFHFGTNGQDRIDAGFSDPFSNRRNGRGAVEVRGSGSLVVIPGSSNVVYVVLHKEGK